MTRLIGVLAVVVLLFFPSVKADPVDLDAVLAEAMRPTQVPAMGMLVIRDGAISTVAVRGVRRSDGADPVSAGDIWHIGSDGKAMTATLIASLVDRGVLSWDASLAQMLPDLVDRMRPEYREVTLIQLLSHHAGLPHDVSDTRFIDSFYADRRPLPEQRLAYIARALEEPPVAPPGTTFNYSNTGFLIAAAIAEHAAGSAYEDLMRRDLFQPLGMTSVGFGRVPAGQPSGHVDGRPISKPDDSNPLIFTAAGDWHLTLQDWAKFCIDQMEGANGHGKILRPETYRTIQTPHPADQPTGLGWGVQDTIAGRQGLVLTHAGSDGSWFAIVTLFPRLRSGVLVVANAGEAMGGEKAATAAMISVLPSLSPAAAAKN